ncbi:hypothetical protein ACIOC1_34285 [Streptomyces sp. NPDC088197]|uniref:hypothetical protein n=1 Tax=unclassified Streptomyces TaxID=2593676 RepID=UPI0036E12DBF
MRTSLAARALAAAGISTTLLMLSVPQAHAEGYVKTYWNNAWAGNESRTWTDKNTDGTWTTLRFTSCRVKYATSVTVVVKLMKERIGPDQNRGKRTFHCASSSTQNWGRQPKGKYHYTIDSVNGRADVTLRSSTVQFWY